MHRFLKTTFAICVISLLIRKRCFTLGQQFEGDTCSLTTGQSGTCRQLFDCKKSLDELRKGIRPQTCGFVGTVPVVCCAEDMTLKEPEIEVPVRVTSPVSTTVTPPVPTTVTRPVQNGERAPGEISRQKCREYAKFVYKTTYPPTGLPISIPIKEKECGLQSVQTIAGGKEAGLREFPHMALIYYQPEDKPDAVAGCGGSVISPNFILTAAHCLEPWGLGSPKYVILGIIKKTDTKTRQKINVKRFIYQPNYKYSTHYDDIGLLELETDINLNTNVRPACLQTEYNFNTAFLPIASGWGRIQYSGSTSESLQKVALEVFPQEECDRSYQNLDKLPTGIRDEVMVCAGSHKEVQDACKGDSGGPLQVFHDSKDAECMYDIVGVISFGKTCGIAVGLPGVYTRVSPYIKWIEDIVWPK